MSPITRQDYNRSRANLIRSGTHKKRSDNSEIELDLNVSSEWLLIIMATFSGYNHGYSNKPPMMSSRILDTFTTTVSSLNMKVHMNYLLPLSPI